MYCFLIDTIADNAVYVQCCEIKIYVKLKIPQCTYIWGVYTYIV